MYHSLCIMTGEARCTYKGGLKYAGSMLNSEFHGKGRLVFGKNGGWYEGHYRLGRQVRERERANTQVAGTGPTPLPCTVCRPPK